MVVCNQISVHLIHHACVIGDDDDVTNQRPLGTDPKRQWPTEEIDMAKLPTEKRNAKSHTGPDQ